MAHTALVEALNSARSAIAELLTHAPDDRRGAADLIELNRAVDMALQRVLTSRRDLPANVLTLAKHLQEDVESARSARSSLRVVQAVRRMLDELNPNIRKALPGEPASTPRDVPKPRPTTSSDQPKDGKEEEDTDKRK